MASRRVQGQTGWAWASCLPQRIGSDYVRSQERRQVRRGVPDGMLLVHQGVEPGAKLATGPVQPAPDRPDRDVQDRADLLVAEAVELLHHDHRAVVGGQVVQGLLDEAVALGALE